MDTDQTDDPAAVGWRFRTPPGWPEQPAGWRPPAGWAPDPQWPPAPSGWQFWESDTEHPGSYAATPQAQPVHPSTAYNGMDTDQTGQPAAVGWRFRTPPGWPEQPAGWRPPAGWAPDPQWPPAPSGDWQFWEFDTEHPGSYAATPQAQPVHPSTAYNGMDTDQTGQPAAVGWRFRTPPGWPEQPVGWRPPAGWAPDPRWPPAPSGWQFWELNTEHPGPYGAPAQAQPVHPSPL